MVPLRRLWLAISHKTQDVETDMEIAGHILGTRTFVVCELSCSHEGKLDKALRLIEQAKLAGADAIKFQCYTPDCLTVDSDHRAYQITKGPWAGRSLWELYSSAQTPFDWMPDLFACARECGLIPFASPFSRKGVDVLESVDCPAYKIASPEIVDLDLIRYAADTGKPLIISTGMANMVEVDDAFFAVGRPSRLALLHCVSAYPADVQDMNLGRIRELAGAYNCLVGLSDHSLGTVAAIAAVALGAQIIEKHIMSTWPNDSLDKAFALEPNEFREFVTMVRAAEMAMRPPVRDAESDSRIFRRRLVWTKDVAAGTLATGLNTRSARAAEGVYPGQMGEGISARKDCNAGEPVT